MIDYAPNLDVHIIPDTVSNAAVYQSRGGRKKNHIVFSVTDILKSTSILILSSLVGMIFRKFGFDEANIITVFCFRYSCHRCHHETSDIQPNFSRL